MSKVSKKPMELVGQIKGLKSDVKTDPKHGGAEKVVTFSVVVEDELNRDDVGALYDLQGKALTMTFVPVQGELEL